MSPVRRAVATLLAVASAFALVLAGVASWTTSTALDTGTFVPLVSPVIEQAPVQAAISSTLADELSGLIATPSLRPLVDHELAVVVASAGFRPVWDAALTVAHRRVVGALTGPPATGVISVDLIGVVAQVLDQLPEPAATLLGRGRTLTTNADATQAQLRAAIARYLGVTLPVGFGTVAVLRADELTPARRAVSVLDGSVPVLVVGGLVLLVLALVAASRRRRTIGTFALAGGALAALAYVVVRQVAGVVADAVPTPSIRPAITAMVEALVGSLHGRVVVVCVVALVVAVLGFLPGRFARR
jgi:MYXO-CTERM domain-containing protein